MRRSVDLSFVGVVVSGGPVVDRFSSGWRVLEGVSRHLEGRSLLNIHSHEAQTFIVDLCLVSSVFGVSNDSFPNLIVRQCSLPLPLEF